MKFLLLSFLILFTFSCNFNQSNSEVFRKSSNYEIQESKANVNPRFEDYPVKQVSAKIDSQTLDKIYNQNESHFNQFYFRRESLEEYCKIFAGKYIAIDMSQGSETARTYIFDYQTGKMFESPLFMYSSEYRRDSRLYVKDPILNERQQQECNNGIFDCKRKYFIWDEKKHQFKEIN